jgi:hypothetical protein
MIASKLSHGYCVVQLQLLHRVCCIACVALSAAAVVVMALAVPDRRSLLARID